MSRFFEELVNNRRDGIAPPQEAERAAAEPTEEAPQPPEVDYEPSPVQGAMTCRRCFGLVSVFRTADHAEGHRRVGA